MYWNKKKIITTKELLLLVVLIPSLFLALIVSKEQQTLTHEAATVGCGNPGDKGNNLGVGKYCTKGGGQCSGTQSPYCSADFRSDVPTFCSRPCASDNDCGTAAKCVGSGLEKGCEPIACSAPPPTNTPTPTKVPTPTVQQATATPTTPQATLPPSPTTPQGPNPTQTTSATPPVQPNTAALALRVFFHGIGNSGDNANPSTASLSNKNPLRTTRPVTVTIYNASSDLMMTKEGTLTYDSANGAFTGTIILGSDLASSNYLIKIKSDGYLRRQLPGIQAISQSLLTAPDITLIAGDTNGDNTVNALDYNRLLECFSDILSRSCDDTTKQMTDLNDDGKVNQFDYNLLLREVSVQNGD